MIELRFTDDKNKNRFNCAKCPQGVMKERKCEQPGFENFKRPISINPPNGNKYNFCPGKATWFEEIVELFVQCRVALETGILPKEGALVEQEDIFSEVFPHFVESWYDHRYQRIWSDVHNFSKVILQAVLGKKGK